ncbi:M14 family zinc carboxypeptidase [Ornithinimicrobium humiphilum]|uniref:Zinc carboxypeptidase n=1 Tax=Ornithinimicrobium humiphilum TaxID=125288 RepID=A0A543KL45_9MICO|nr:M14 family zinc carboxypeptidase [Ornithinimicrobium humiphilum]TQM95774.1 zinc carboxypeptidase [Ornithinimicrobium humiphilum]
MSLSSTRRTLVGAVASSIALSLALAPSASSDPGPGPGKGGPEAAATAAADAKGKGKGLDKPSKLKPGKPGKPDKPGKPQDGDWSGLDMPQSYPFQPELRVYPHNPDDRSYAGNLIGHADLAPRLMELMAQSDRISVQVVGQSSEGRDLYLVTLTAPEKKAETKKQTKYREMIQKDPVKAAKDKKLAQEYKTPVWFSSNIHGNEWEGTDASMNVIEDLVNAPWSEVEDLLTQHRIYFSLSLNPDGRTVATRANAQNFDANRDMITNTTPETVSYIRTTQELLALYAADMHGYTTQLQVEPTGPPHGENYEYDLFIPHNYALALKIEEDVVDAAIPGNPLTRAGGIKIPYRDTPSGWDDYPPIFTAQYAAFYGTLSSTVELPMGRTGSVMTPARAAINVAVAEQVIRSTIEYVHENSDEMLANQIEFFRRALSGEPKTALTLENIDAVPGPEQWKPLWDVTDNQDPVELPQAYVIPMDGSQRSLSDATALVEQLLLHSIEVTQLNKDWKVDGVTYPKGSYVVDMAQSKRALANALLDLGTDISDRLPSMYDISAWSYSYLWGATVHKVGDVTAGPVKHTKPLAGPVSVAEVPKKAQHLAFEVAGVNDYVAINDLVSEDADVWLLPSGQAVVGPQSYSKAVNAAIEHDIAFRAATPAEVKAVNDGDAQELDEVRTAYVGNQDARFTLLQLGFEDPVALTAASITANPAVLDDVDVILVNSAFTFNSQTAAGRAAVEAWLAEGHALIGIGSNGFNAASALGLVSASANTGPGSGNGIVKVETPAGSFLEPHKQDYAFVYPAQSYGNLGANTKAEQYYAEGNPLLAGHWRGTATTGPLGAGGRASVISGESASGGKAIVFGTTPTFRTHPKGGQSQVGQAIFSVLADD